MRLVRIPCLPGISGPLRSQCTTRLIQVPARRRGLATKAAVPADFAFAFDIDGVLVRSSKPLPGASQSLSLLQKQQIPFVLLTNGGGVSETDRVTHLSERLNVPLSRDLIIQSHTPFAELVGGKEGQEPLENKCVLVVGGPGDQCREVAKQYGFKSVLTPGDIFMSHPAIWPFAHGFTSYYEKVTHPLIRRIDPANPSQSLKVDAILVFNDPRDWALDIQIIVDFLLSHNGIAGTVSDKNNRDDLPNRGYQQDGQPALYISNPDILWAAGYHQPRLGQGAFSAALEGVWNALTGGPASGVELQKTTIGKPHQLTYEFAEKRLIEQRNMISANHSSTPLKTVYMIGDNPESDIKGAASYNDFSSRDWVPVLVRSGVYSGGRPSWTPKIIHDGVEQAVNWCLEHSRWNQNISSK